MSTPHGAETLDCGRGVTPWTRISIVLKRDDLGSFWPLQIGGGAVHVLTLVLYCPPQAAGHGAAWFIWWPMCASCLLRPVCRSLMSPAFSWIALEMRAFAWSLMAGAITAYVAELLTFGNRPVDWADWLVTFTQATFILFVWCSLYFSIKLWQQSARERERLLRAESQVRDARLNALRHQLNPHFLFNSLNAVSTLVLDGMLQPPHRMLAQIGEFLRTILDRDAIFETPFRRRLPLPSSTWRSSRPDSEAGCGLGDHRSRNLGRSGAEHVVTATGGECGETRRGPTGGGGTIRIQCKLHRGHLQISIQNTATSRARAQTRG